MRVDGAAKELRRLGKTADEDDIIVVILNGVSSGYDTQVRLLEYGDGINSSRNNILQSITHQYYRLAEISCRKDHSMRWLGEARLRHASSVVDPATLPISVFHTTL